MKLTPFCSKRLANRLVTTLSTLLALFAACPVGAQPFAYSVNPFANNVAFINTANNSVFGALPLPPGPQNVVINATGTRLYVTNTGDTSLTVVDTVTATRVTTLSIGYVWGIVLHPASPRAYVANRDANSVAVMDTGSNSIISGIPVGNQPLGVAINPTGTRLYVANNGGGSVSVIDVATSMVIATVAVGNQPIAVTVNPAGTRAYVVNRGTNNVSIIDLATNTTVGMPIAVGPSPAGIAINPAGTRVYVGNSGGSSLSVIETTGNTVLTTVALPFDPFHQMAFNTAGSILYVPMSNAGNAIAVVDTATNTVSTTISVASPFGVAVNPTSNPMVPASPTIGTATGGNAQASVAFTPPAFNGGSAITGYTVTANPGGNTASGPASPLVVTGLTNGQTYTFTVQANNALGAGFASAASNSVTLAVPPVTAIVTNTADSGMGSLRQAILDTNNVGVCPTTSTINFNIPGPGPHVISPATDLPTIDCPTLINGYSQPGAAPNSLANASAGSNAVIKIRIDGAGAMLTGNGLTFVSGAAGAIVRGLSIGGFTNGPAIHVGSGANSVLVAGNFLGVAPDGTPAGNRNGVEVFADAVQIGASAPAARNVVACSSSEGVEILGSADVYNNEIGTRPDGTTACGNSTGIDFKEANGGEVGAPGAGNFIRNNLGDGIFLDSTDFIRVSNNVIANNGGNGIAFGTRSDCAGSGNAFVGNKIGTQDGYGILLKAFGSRAVNDPLDTDGSGCGSDGNHGQNYPVIDTVTYRPDKTLLDFTLPSEVSKSYDIEVFSNAVADTANKGRGETSRATTTVMTDAAGSVSVTNFIVSNTAPDALNISMLATEQPQADTSEFSNAYITPASFAPLAGLTAFAITAGGNQTQTITFTNTLGQPASFAAPSILPAGNFTVSANTCSTMVAFPGTCQITVQYARAMAGMDTAVLEVVLPSMANPAAGANTKYQFPLSGTAIPGTPVITVTGTTTFPPTSLNALSPFQTLTITNAGGANLSISAVSNSNSAAFFDTADGAPPQPSHYCGLGSNAAGAPLAGGPIVIPPLATCQLNIAFKAIAVGANTANIVISSNDPMFPTRSVTLTGTGLAAPPAVTLGMAPATVAVGGTATLTLTLTTPSAPNDPLIMGAVATLPAGLAVAAMPLPTTTCGTTVTASGQNISFSGGSIPPMPGCTISVPVTATVAGSNSVNFAAGALSTSKGTNSAAATTALTATNTPTMTAAFAPATVLINTNSTLTLTLSNPNPTPAFMPLGGVVNMPIGLVIASLVDNCGASAFINFSTVTTISLGMSGTIPAMGSCTITVQAQSNIAGAYTVSVSPGNLVTSLGNNTNTSMATLTVAAPAPAITLSQTTVPFGSRTVNTTSPTTTVTLTNSGTANLVITSITSAGDFGYTTTCPISTPPIAPAAAPCNINITFTPLTVGALTGTVTIVSNATGSPHIISLAGSGAPVAVPGIAISAATLNLGGTVVNTTGAQQSIVITNSGFATLNLTGIAVTGVGFARVTPSTGSPANCATSVAPSGTCQIAIACTPTALGTIAGQLSITHNATGSPTNIALSCTGNSLPVPVIALTPSVDFGDQIVNTASTVRNVSIGNTGTAPLTVSAISITGANANQFLQSGQCASVAPGASCPLAVTFTPTSIGAKTASISVTSNAQNAATVNSISLTGNGVLAPRPLVNLSLTAIGYGNSIFGGASSSQTVMLKNEGGLPLTITSITAVGDFLVSNNCGPSVASLGTCSITVAFTPLGVGGRTGEFVIVSNAQGSPHRVVLSGTGCRWFSQAGNRLFLTSCGN